MSEPAIENSQSTEDEVRNEIDLIIVKGREKLKSDARTFQPKKKGYLLPALLNVILLVTALIIIFGSWRLFEAAQQNYALQSVTRQGTGADIISALLAEAETALEQKTREILAIQAEIASIEAQLESLGLSDPQGTTTTLSFERRTRAEVGSSPGRTGCLRKSNPRSNKKS
jgi:cell division protein FtsB